MSDKQKISVEAYLHLAWDVHMLNYVLPFVYI